jgi:amino acid transporter, AAT family
VMGFSSDTRIALIVGPIWFILLVVVYYSKGFHKR